MWVDLWQQQQQANPALAVGWAMLAVFFTVCVILSLAIVKYYSDRHDSHPLTTAVSVLALSTTLMCVLAVPMDIVNVASLSDSENANSQLSPQAISDRENTIRLLYFSLYSCLLVCGFVFIPFAYFYFEADHDMATVGEKTWSATKYTTLFVVVICVLLAVGVVAQADSNNSDAQVNGSQSWLDNVVLKQTREDAAVTFALASMACVGLVGFCFYTAYGFVHIPIDMMLSHVTPDVDVSEASDELRDVREAIRVLQSKYTLTGRKMTRKDKRDLDRLCAEEKLLERRCQRLREGRGRFSWLLDRLHPLFRFFGLILFLAVLVVVTALGTTSVDRATNSDCQERCGWAINKRAIWNPIDEALINIHQESLYALDYMVLGLMLVAIVFCSLGGMIKMGIRVACIQMYKLEPRSSAPQGLLLMAFHLMFILLVINVELLTLAPQYVTFGAQTVTEKSNTRLCTLNDVGKSGTQCRMTQISLLLHQQTANLPIFGILFFVDNWVFLALIVLFTIIKVASPSKRAGQQDDGNHRSRSYDPEEHQRLL